MCIGAPLPNPSAEGLEELSQRVKHDLQALAYPEREWVQPLAHESGQHVYDVAIIGGGQCGLAAAFGLRRERVANVVVLDENPPGLEGPWVTYARMITLRTHKSLTGLDFGMPSLTFSAYFEAKYGRAAWTALDKIPRTEWMAYLVWYRSTLQLPVMNSTRVERMDPEPLPQGGWLFRLHLRSTAPGAPPPPPLLARKVVLATGIQGGGEWHVPSVVASSVPKHLYAHTCEAIDFGALRGKRVAILGGGASAFDNAQYALEAGVGEAHVFVRRAQLPRVNPIRFMEGAGFLRHFADLDDATKYAGIDHFMKFNQPPTNDTFMRAARFDNFTLHLASPWERLVTEGDQVRVFTPQGDQGLFDLLVVSTGLLTDARLRPELSAVSEDIATWADKFVAPEGVARNPLIDAHPYLGRHFELQEKVAGRAPYLTSLFAYNYSALPSLGLSGSALSGMKYALPKLITGVTGALWRDQQAQVVASYMAYADEEFVASWPLDEARKRELRALLGDGADAAEAATDVVAGPCSKGAASGGAREGEAAAAAAGVMG